MDSHYYSGQFLDLFDLDGSRFHFSARKLRDSLLDQVLLLLLTSDIVVELHNVPIHISFIAVDFSYFVLQVRFHLRLIFF
jgi:hypothetical protein